MQAGVDKKRSNLPSKLKARGGIKKNRKEKDGFNWRDDYCVPEWVVSQVHPKRRWLLRWLEQRLIDGEQRGLFARAPAARIEPTITLEEGVGQLFSKPAPLKTTQAPEAAVQGALTISRRDEVTLASALPGEHAVLTVTAGPSSEVDRAPSLERPAYQELLAQGVHAGRSPAAGAANEPLAVYLGQDSDNLGRHSMLQLQPSPARVKKRKLLRKGGTGEGRRSEEEPDKHSDAVQCIDDRAVEQAAAQAEEELREQSEHRAQGQTEASLAQEKVQEAAHRAEVEAQQELAQAAELEAAAQAASSLRRETLRAAPDPLAEAPPEPQVALSHLAEVSEQSSEHADNTTGDPPPPAGVSEAVPTLSASGKHSPSPLEDRGAQLEQDASRSRAPSQDNRHGQSKSAHGGNAQRRKAATGPGEVDNGKAKPKKMRARPPPNAPIAETRGSGDLGHGKGQKGGKGAPEDSQLSPVRPNGKQSPLTLVDFQEEGLQQERLGELDLKQLDSFRSLWTTIRSAYSARLPRDMDLKLVYQDADGDLLLLQPDEPWQPFVASTRRIVVSCKWPQ